ncbi:unnamed protein product [Rotaria magnacalcarata]|uniref:Fucosyltransferase n=4 Tax=Rotaria magnacalcarata TaxID=392030 RepID=A0A819EA61_9BILA|nr:unnamed protein product [Rotaria magnacalcarata]CAF3848209.1 unnamed protein product [Rotaria magnacalcarata]
MSKFALYFHSLKRYIDDDGEPIGTVYITETRGRLDKSILTDYVKDKADDYFSAANISVPILVWWTPFTYDTGSYTRCNNNQARCFISNIRKYRDNKQFSAFLFYGTSFRLYDLPLPRHEHEQWSLIHEESPKNNYAFSFESIMNMFNHTATFKRHSDLPLTTQWLASIDDLLDQTYVIDVKEKTQLQTTENLAPIIYIQSDCNTPSDRDLYIKELMKYIQIDSYGGCLHNKDLPENLRNPVETMEHDEILKLVSKYKFALAFENAICTDYITEKFWRPLKVGTVPIVYGSDEFQDFLPDNHSAISMLDFTTPELLARFIHELNVNDTMYDSYRHFKLYQIISNDTLLVRTMSERKWGIHNDRVRGNFIHQFECLVCERVHKTRQDPTIKYQAKFDDYGCPPPTTFDKNGEKLEHSGNWYRSYEFARCQLEVFHELLDQKNYSFTEKDINNAATKRFAPSFRRDEFLR